MKVSVVIPVYNAQETIVRALDSVINQTIKPFEIVLTMGVLISQSLS
jgi:glycosyltransferase involved in cell wall biosynthesis